MNSWNERKTISTEIKEAEWAKLLHVSFPNRRDIVEALRESGNKPVALSALIVARREKANGTGQTSFEYFVGRDIDALNALYIRRKLPFAIRFVDVKVAYDDRKIRMCKVKKDPAITRRYRVAKDRGPLSFNKALRVVRHGIMSFHSPAALFARVVRRLCP